MAWARAGLALAAVGLVALSALSGGSSVDPPVPRGFPGIVPAFLIAAGGAKEVGSPPRGSALRSAGHRDRRWLARARPLGARAPRWAHRLYRRSLLVLRAATAPNGAVVAGARPGWAYVWPRDAGAVALALAASDYRREARRIAGFLRRLDLEAAARFDWSGRPVAGRAAQGDAGGWVAAAARAAGLSAPIAAESPSWRYRADYQEGDPGMYVGNALAAIGSGVLFPALRRERHTGSAEGNLRAFAGESGLVRIAGEPDSGWDSAAAWGVRPFAHAPLFPTIRRTLLRAAGSSGRFGIVPSQRWHGGEDPWTAPTAWVAWSLAALSRDATADGRAAVAVRDRRAALRLIVALRRAATPLDLLPERVDAETGAPASTTPLAWSHAFTALALRELWGGPLELRREDPEQGRDDHRVRLQHRAL